MKKILNIKKNTLSKKILIKLCRKIGFEVVDQNNLTVPTIGKKINDNLNIFNEKLISLPLGEIKVTRKIKKILIILRTFTKENKLLSQNKKRLFEKEKKEYTLRSIKSLCKNLSLAKKHFNQLNFFFKIIDDNSSKETKYKFKKICKKEKIKFEIDNLNTDQYKYKMKFKNNSRMIDHNCHIFQSKEFALNSDYDLIYFVEDDYIHNDDALIEMIYTFQKLSTIFKDDVILCPSDYPYLYSKFENTNILIGHNKHWRKVNESLCTYMISRKTLKKYWSYYQDMFLNNYDPYEKPLHRLYKKINCFSPMPSLAMHLTNINSIYGLSPLLNWVKLWNKNKY